ncbi:unnamed protein product, partial [Trichogramma brassicae]
MLYWRTNCPLSTCAAACTAAAALLQLELAKAVFDLRDSQRTRYVRLASSSGAQRPPLAHEAAQDSRATRMIAGAAQQQQQQQQQQQHILRLYESYVYYAYIGTRRDSIERESLRTRIRPFDGIMHPDARAEKRCKDLKRARLHISIMKCTYLNLLLLLLLLNSIPRCRFICLVRSSDPCTVLHVYYRTAARYAICITSQARSSSSIIDIGYGITTSYSYHVPQVYCTRAYGPARFKGSFIMVSRRKILSRSRDNLADTQYEVEEEEDVWYNVDKLYKDHIQEVLDKWNQIDDEIWAKVIVFERNRRVAKAYARAPVLTVNDSMDGFDGFRIGLCGFDNPMRDAKTEEARRQINHGVKIKMDGDGNILIKRMCKSNVYVRPTSQAENAIGPEIVRNSQGALEYDKPGKLFDMAKFSANLTQETRQAYPDRRRLETQCLSAIVFVKTDADLLQCPIWVLIVNVVGLDMLKSKLPPVGAVPRPVDIKNRPRIPIPDEDPYSIAGTSSSTERGIGSSGGHPAFAAYKQHQLEREHARLTGHRRGGGSAGGAGKPPKLPPRENLYGHDIPKPDYDDIENDYAPSTARAAAMDDKKSKKENNKKY